MENRTNQTQKLDALNPFRVSPSENGPEADLVTPTSTGEIKLADIVLTPDEKVDALRDALTAKRHRISLERNQTMEKLRLLDMQIQGPRTPIDLWKAILGRGRDMAESEEWEDPFVIPDFSHDIYRSLCYYFTGDESGMMHYHLSPRKGLLLFGGIGVGKSVLMKLFARNTVQSYRVVTCAEIELEYGVKDNAQPTIEKYSHMKPNAYKGQYFNQDALGYCFDDLGAEQVANNYGKRDMMIDVLEARYANPLCKGAKTHITTNLTLEQIEARYTSRVLDRMRQMFNLIEFPANIESLRQ